MRKKGADQTVQMRRLICAFVVCIRHKTGFPMTRVNYNDKSSYQSKDFSTVFWRKLCATKHRLGFETILPHMLSDLNLRPHDPRHEKTCSCPIEQQRCRSASTFAQSDQHLCCSLLR